MPKINVYLPDELAEAVKDAGVPISAICQRALEQAVRRITAIRQTTLGEFGPGDLDERFPQFTARARAVITTAVERARSGASPSVGTGDLLAGMIDERHNLGLQVLRAIEVDPAAVQRDLARRSDREPGVTAATAPHFSGPAAGALELAVTEATSMGHNYVGCEHLLLGLVGEPDGVAGQVLRSAGADARLTRRAVTAALVGYAHLRDQSTAPTAGQLQALATAVGQQLQPLVARIERLEQRLDVAGEAH
jgi:ATP-dependent Clp protease ATP-binding subunit ClpA